MLTSRQPFSLQLEKASSLSFFFLLFVEPSGFQNLETLLAFYLPFTLWPFIQSKVKYDQYSYVTLIQISWFANLFLLYGRKIIHEVVFVVDIDGGRMSKWSLVYLNAFDTKGTTQNLCLYLPRIFFKKSSNNHFSLFWSV